MSKWSLESWKNYILDQAPGWEDSKDLKTLQKKLKINLQLFLKMKLNY